jgi:hypothetical protein
MSGAIIPPLLAGGGGSVSLRVGFFIGKVKQLPKALNAKSARVR